MKNHFSIFVETYWWCWDWAGGDGGAVGLSVWFGVADSWAGCGVGGGLFG